MAQESYSGGGGGGGGGGSGGSGGASICSSSGSRSKKIKQKKVPQRGLGVAQLEKIREEQQKKEALQAANSLAKKAIGGSSNDSVNRCLGVKCPEFRPNLSHFPLPPPSPNALFRHSPSAPNLEILRENSVHFSKNSNPGGGVEIGGLQPGNSNWSRLWNSDNNHNLGGEKQQMFDHNPFAFRPPPPQVNLSYESTPQGPVLPQRSHQFQQPFSFSSMVNAASGISPSSVLSSQTEPPSNQSSHGNNYRPSWPDEDKMVGIKRSYPFSLESPPAPSFNVRPTYASSISRSDNDLASCNNRYAAQMEPRNKYIREGSSNSSSLPEQNQSEVIEDNGMLNGDFLTLAPPVAATSTPSNSKQKNSFNYSSEFECMGSQENGESQIHGLGPSGSFQQQPFSFFPTKLQMDQSTRQVNNGNGEKRETLDLNLKL